MAAFRLTGLVLAAIAAAILIAEAGLAAISGWSLPILPYSYDAAGMPRLPADRRIQVRFPGGTRQLYITDGAGARIARRERGAPPPLDALQVFGDSQSLGYGMAFDATFASQYAHRLGLRGPVRLYGAPTSDVEVLAAGLCAEQDELRPAQRQIIVLNLGNDLDEMYVAGQSRRSGTTPALETWLSSHSQLYTRTLIARSGQAIAQHPLPGINPVLFQLDARERVLLAREAVARIEAIAACTRAERRLVLILPSDFQVDPDELEKYARFSADPAVFEDWLERRESLAEMLNATETYIARRLEEAGFEVASFRLDLEGDGYPAEILFQRSSHHLTPLAHARLAEILAEREIQP